VDTVVTIVGERLVTPSRDRGANGHAVAEHTTTPTSADDRVHPRRDVVDDLDRDGIGEEVRLG
jgi:hypothetical protein